MGLIKSDSTESHLKGQKLEDNTASHSNPDWNTIEDIFGEPIPCLESTDSQPLEGYGASDSAISDIKPEFNLADVIESYNKRASTYTKKFKPHHKNEKNGVTTIIYTRERYKTIDALLVASSIVDGKYHEELAVLSIKKDDKTGLYDQSGTFEGAVNAWINEKSGFYTKEFSALYRSLAFFTGFPISMATAFTLGRHLAEIGWRPYTVVAAVMAVSVAATAVLFAGASKIDQLRNEKKDRQLMLGYQNDLEQYRNDGSIIEGDEAVERAKQLTKQSPPKKQSAPKSRSQDGSSLYIQIN